MNMPVKNKTGSIYEEAGITALYTNLLELEVKAAESSFITSCMIRIGCPYNVKEISDWQ